MKFIKRILKSLFCNRNFHIFGKEGDNCVAWGVIQRYKKCVICNHKKFEEPEWHF